MDLVWRLTDVLWRYILWPVVQQLWKVVLFIWNSPVLSSLSTLGCLGLLWGHHSGTYRWEMLETLVIKSQAQGTKTAMQLAWFCYEHSASAGTFFWKWAKVVGSVIWLVAKNTQAQLVAAAESGDIESPRLAWVSLAHTNTVFPNHGLLLLHR